MLVKSGNLERMQTIRNATWAGCWALGLALAQTCAWAAEPTPAHEPRLRSAMAIVVDQDTNEVLYEKNADHVSSIASITKLMTAMVTLDSQLPLDEDLVVTREDRASGWANSRLRPGTHLSREQALHLALMSSENHAAHLLGRTYPGGVEAIVDAMNAKAQLIGMTDANFADPTGLSPENRASAADLVRMVKAAYDYPEIRYDSVSTDMIVPVGHHTVHYQNTNHLTSRPDWQIGLQKTGYIAAAGRCLVMQAAIAGRRVVMVLLDSVGSASRFADAQRLRDWIKATKGADTSASATF
ncbi:MAG TPA: serine hydrolase [Burkholderiaceae bacterium]|jgi:D-alanyl-D-alanine endopeptidase (penicillin-binding protein 7)|nr:serine hydrolase [Burkholderiaceae bacterium]